MASLESRIKKKGKRKENERREKRRGRVRVRKEGERENVKGIEKQPFGGGEARLIEEKYGGRGYGKLALRGNPPMLIQSPIRCSCLQFCKFGCIQLADSLDYF